MAWLLRRQHNLSFQIVERNVNIAPYPCNCCLVCGAHDGSGDCLDHMGDESMKLMTFPVKVENDEVFLDLPPVSELDQVKCDSSGVCPNFAALACGGSSADGSSRGRCLFCVRLGKKPPKTESVQ